MRGSRPLLDAVYEDTAGARIKLNRGAWYEIALSQGENKNPKPRSQPLQSGNKHKGQDDGVLLRARLRKRGEVLSDRSGER